MLKGSVCGNGLVSSKFSNDIECILVWNPADIFIVFSLPCFTPPQPTGMPPVLSWSSLPCHALLASSQESSPSPTSLPLRGSTAHLLLGSCSLFQVSHGYSNQIMTFCFCLLRHICHKWLFSGFAYHVNVLSIGSTWRHPTEMTFATVIINVNMCHSLPPYQLSLFCLQWPFTLEWLWTSWASALVTGASLGPTY